MEVKNAINEIERRFEELDKARIEHLKERIEEITKKLIYLEASKEETDGKLIAFLKREKAEKEEVLKQEECPQYEETKIEYKVMKEEEWAILENEPNYCDEAIIEEIEDEENNEHLNELKEKIVKIEEKLKEAKAEKPKNQKLIKHLKQKKNDFERMLEKEKEWSADMENIKKTILENRELSRIENEKNKEEIEVLEEMLVKYEWTEEDEKLLKLIFSTNEKLSNVEKRLDVVDEMLVDYDKGKEERFQKYLEEKKQIKEVK